MIAKDIVELLKKCNNEISPGKAQSHRMLVKDDMLELDFFHKDKYYPVMITSDEEINVEEIIKLVKDTIKKS